jgi:hypothetical protein
MRATHVVNEQVCLLTGFIGQFYDVCVLLRRRFVPDSRTPWMTVGLRNSIRERDAMNSRAPGFVLSSVGCLRSLERRPLVCWKEDLILPCLQGFFGQIFEVWVFVSCLIFLRWVLVPKILLISRNFFFFFTL